MERCVTSRIHNKRIDNSIITVPAENDCCDDSDTFQLRGSTVASAIVRPIVPVNA